MNLRHPVKEPGINLKELRIYSKEPYLYVCKIYQNIYHIELSLYINILMYRAYMQRVYVEGSFRVYTQTSPIYDLGKHGI